jgi:predicted metal-binding membrane protein
MGGDDERDDVPVDRADGVDLRACPTKPAWCVGCCGALMAVLFALGVMSVPWMIVVASMIAVEKLLPWRAT